MRIAPFKTTFKLKVLNRGTTKVIMDILPIEGDRDNMNSTTL